MAQEKQFQSALPDLITQMFGTKSSATTSQTSSANTAPLQQVFDRAQQPMDQQLYDNLIASIFQKAAVQVPTLTAALANATGSRSSNNSPLALALNEQNNMAAKDSATAILGQQNTQAQLAGNAAQGIAQATKGATTTQKATAGKPGINPLAMTALGFILNKADKGKWGEKLMGMFSPSAATNFPVAAPSFGTGVGGEATPTFAENMPVMSAASPAPVMGGGAMDFNDLGSMFPGVDLSGGGGDLGAGALDNFDFSGLLSDFGGSNFGDLPFGDVGSMLGGGNAFTGGLDFGGSDFLSEDVWNFFADGGSTSRVQRNRNNMGASPTLFGQSAINSPASAPTGAGGNQGISSDVIAQMLQKMVQQEQVQKGRPQPATAPLPARDLGRDSEGEYGNTVGQSVNARAGNPLGNAVAQALAMAALGMIAPNVVAGATGSLPAAQMTNTAIKAGTSQSTSPMNLAITLAQAIAAEREATSAIQTAEDPLGAMLSAFQAVDGSIGDLSAVGSDNLAAGANAASAVTRQDPLDALMAASNAFGTAPAAPAAPIDVYGPVGGDGDAGGYGLGGDYGDTGGASLGGGLGGGGFGGIGDAGYGDFADGGLTRMATGKTGVKKKPSAGMIKGPGDGTSDNIRAKSTVPGGKGINVSGKEFIVPADVTAVPGVQTMLETLIKNYHTPVNR